MPASRFAADVTCHGVAAFRVDLCSAASMRFPYFFECTALLDANRAGRTLCSIRIGISLQPAKSSSRSRGRWAAPGESNYPSFLKHALAVLWSRSFFHFSSFALRIPLARAHYQRTLFPLLEFFMKLLVACPPLQTTSSRP